MRPNRDTRVLASTSGMQIDEEQHLRDWNPNRRNESLQRVKEIWASVLIKRGAAADAQAEQKICDEWKICKGRNLDGSPKSTGATK
jgi:hypothetical protein